MYEDLQVHKPSHKKHYLKDGKKRNRGKINKQLQKKIEA